MKNKIKILLCIIFIIAAGPFINQRLSVYFFLTDQASNPKDYIFLWAISDLHLDSEHTGDFASAIDDLSENSLTADAAIVAGDIIDYKMQARFFQDILH